MVRLCSGLQTWGWRSLHGSKNMEISSERSPVKLLLKREGTFLRIMRAFQNSGYLWQGIDTDWGMKEPSGDDENINIPVYNFDLHSIFHRWTYILDWPRNSFGFFLWENLNKVFGQPNKNSLSKCTEDFCILLYAVISHLKRERQISYAIANMWN